MSKAVSNESYANYLTKSRKSFSLVELAIYIVAVGVLTGVAVGGMEVVNNAKVQKVMEEMDSYKTAMYLFQSTFGALPGNVTESLCKDTNEFNNLSAPGGTDAEGIYCGTKAQGNVKSRTVASANETLLATETSQNSFLNSMRFLVASGIKSDAARTNLYTSPLAQEPTEDIVEKAEKEDFNEANLLRFKRLEFWMQNHKKEWTDNTFGRDRLCEAVGYNRHLILQCVRSQGYNNVHDYINRYRIEELKQLISKGKITALGEVVDAGFGTIQTARSCFLKMEGITLDEYWNEKKNFVR